MGGAIARGLVKKAVLSPGEIVCTAKTPKTLGALASSIPGVGVSSDNTEAVRGADWIFLCVKPWLIESVAKEIRGSIAAGTPIVCVAAGIDFAQLEHFFGEGAFPLFRIMPNTAIACGESMTFLASKNATKAQTQLLSALLSALGKTVQIDEALMGAGTALASCGIAFAMRYVRAACVGGVELGFYPSVAREVVLQTLRGAIAVLEESGANPETEIDRVTTPGGVTIRGLNAMEAAGFTRAVVEGLKAARG